MTEPPRDRPTRRDPSVVAQIIELYATGLSCEQVGTQVELSSRTVWRVLRDEGVPRRYAGGKRGRGTTADWVRQYEHGATIPEIATSWSRSHSTIRGALRAAGVQMRDDRATRSGGRAKVYDPADTARAVALYAEGWSIAQVARELHCGETAVRSWLAAANVTTRPAAHLPGGRRPTGNTLAALKTRLAELGVNAADVKAWAVRTGHLHASGPGLPPSRLIEAYADAHPTGGAA